ncbi:MAG TPA: hypothetical protein VL049_00115 [Candidatus Dormibacteraeota bacterium]|nr:hypothetical protein [Candidatus Dormibacteraeota bacterium]
MTAPADALAIGLAFALSAGAALALWWLLRRERGATLLALAALTAAALALRLLYLDDYPRGLNEDEPKVLAAAIGALREGRLLAESTIAVPILMHALFQATLVPLLGIGRWTIRLYSLIGGALCVPAAFATARAMRLSTVASLGAAALITVLPWALFYSRVMQGAELTFQQLLLLAALAALIWRGGGWVEALIGAFALAWMLYGYWCTRAMLPMPLLAALLAGGRRRAWCVAVLAVGVVPYLPYPPANPQSVYVGQGLQPSLLSNADPALVWSRTLETLAAFVAPVAQDGWLTVRAGAVHPILLLLLALAGALSGWRRTAFLAGGFALGLAPTVFAWGAPSTHRMMMAFPFVALAAAAACDDLVPRRAWRTAAVAVMAGAVGLWSVRFYFSDDFWLPESRWLFDWERSELVAALPLDAGRPVILMRQVTQFEEPRRFFAADDRLLTVENWQPPPQGALYAFTAEAEALRPFYAARFGAERVRAFGRAFIADVPAGDWSALREHGWTYCARCQDRTLTGIVPTLQQMGIGFADLACNAPSTHTWAGRWEGAETRLRVRGGESTVAVVETPHQRAAGVEVEVDVAPGDRVRVTTHGEPGLPFAAVSLTVAGQVPAWESVSPVACESGR